MTYDPNDHATQSMARTPAKDRRHGELEGRFIANEAGPACWQQQHRTGEPPASQGWLGPCGHDRDQQPGPPDLGWSSEVLF